MAAAVRAMTLGQNYHHHHHHHQLMTQTQLQNSSCIILAGPDTPPPSSAGSPPLILSSPSPPIPMHHHMIGKRTIAPAMQPQQTQLQVQSQQQHLLKGGNPVIRFSGSDIKNTTTTLGPKNSSKAMKYTHMSQYTTGPMPSVERRNARERNRVKQVNNGFDKLRQHIPPKIVEVENGGRGASKKLSKVDTLKLAVKYIQRLKEMLDENNNRLQGSSSETSSTISTTSSLSTTSSSLSYYSASPAPSHHHNMQVTYASTPISYQENHHIPACSEPSVSPTPSYHSDVSSHHPQQVYVMPNAQFTSTPTEEGPYTQNYDQMAFVDEDSGSFEEDGILDDILHWQLQN